MWRHIVLTAICKCRQPEGNSFWHSQPVQLMKHTAASLLLPSGLANSYCKLDTGDSKEEKLCIVDTVNKHAGQTGDNYLYNHSPDCAFSVPSF